MVDWDLTEQKFGITKNSKLGKRPKIICRCDNCPKTQVITVRVKSRLTNGFPWLCFSCVGLNRSDELSAQLKANWADNNYREMQKRFRTSPAYKEKQAISIRKKWNDPNYRSQIATGINRDNFIKRSMELYGDRFDYSNTIFGTWKDPIIVCCKTCGHISTKAPQKQLDFGFCQKCGLSFEQRQISEFVQSLTSCTINDRETIKPYELDININTNRIAIEHHGVYWHSYNRLETKEERTRHQHKAKLCQSLGIKLLQFFDFEWNERPNLIKSMIKNALHISQPINARQLELVWPTNKEIKPFFDKNHLYGHRPAKYTIALKDDDNIIIAASFSRYKDGYEIIRLASNDGISVRGGASRLIVNFRKQYQFPLYTYADLRYSTGNVYRQLGFSELHTTTPNYYYIKNNILLSRQQCQKNKLHALLPTFDQALSESQNMFNNGYRRLWDAGHLKMFLK